MICSNCGTENPDGTKFCIECAARLSQVCPSCGKANLPTAKFCGECAAPIHAVIPTAATARPAGSSAAPVAERRLVSILFADLVSFTTLAEGRDAEDTRELLSRYFVLSRDVIGRYGGIVEKFIGDAVMAVWGAPVAHEDDAERAVRAGLELVNAVRTLGPTIHARAGVLTGEAAVTLGAVGEGMVAGDLVNTASRLQSVATPGTVLVGEATVRAADRAIVFEPAGEQSLKGKAAPVAAWRALRVVAERGGRKRAETLEAPFVGRDDELRLLKDLFHATGREKRARLVSVIGPAGIGKTRLAWEFTKYLDGLVENVWWHDGRSPAYGEGISFWALGEMVRRRAGLLETDDEPTTRAKIAETLATHVPDPDERRWIEPALLALLGVESGVSSEQLFAAWRTFFERLAATAPVVMVFEDFHFADSGLLDFVDHLLEWSRNVPIYVVTLSRLDLLERRPDWGAGKRNFVSVYLEPLLEPAMFELLAGLVPGLPGAAARAIVDRAGGIPLYAVETVRMLLADGRLALQAGTYHPVGDLTTLAVPETLTALIASRLDGLAADDRALVSDAAVLGQSFTLAGLSAVAGIGEGELEPRLRALVRRELLTLEADPRSPELGQYVFVQALIREVAYNTLARADRKVRHLAAARFFESLGSEELAGGLAGHYLAAHQNAAEGREAEALAAQARIALRAAADRAGALGSHDQAVVFLRQALTVTTDPAEETETLERLGDSASAAGHYETAEGFLRRAVDLHRSRGDRDGTARVTAALGADLVVAFRVPEARALLEPAAAEFADLGAEPSAIALLGQLARALFLDEEPRRAIEVADRMLEPAERANEVAIVADALITRGSALTEIGRDYEGLGAIEAGLRLALSHGLHRVALRGRNNLGAYQIVRDPVSALETLRAGIAEATRLGMRQGAIHTFLGASDAAFVTGEWDWAIDELRSLAAGELDDGDKAAVLADFVVFAALRGEAIEADLEQYTRLIARSSDAVIVASTHHVKGILGWSAGNLGVAHAELAEAARLSGQYAPARYPEAARVALWSGDAEGADRDLRALDAIGAHGPAIELRRQIIRAGIAAVQGRPSDALALYRETLERARDLKLAWEEALIGVDMAVLMGPHEPEVRAAIAGAHEILTRLRARPVLDRLETATRRQSSLPSPEGARSRDTSSV